MVWINQTKPPHVCWKPGITFDVSRGDIWQCDVCKVQWQVTSYWGWKRRLEE